MLIEYKVKNFLSFKDLNTLSMVGIKSFKEFEDSNIIQVDDKLKILKTAVIYGNNASGKSNLIKSMGFMKGLVINSFRDALMEDNNDKKIPVKKFLLSKKSEKEPAYFEVSFFINSVKYRYGFEIEENKVCSEWLFHTTSKETVLFTRDEKEFHINKSSFKEALELESKTKENVLFLTLVAQLNGEISNKIINWFKNFNVISGLNDSTYKRYTINKFKADKDFQKWVNNFVRNLEIFKLTIEEEDNTEIDIERLKDEDEDFANLLASVQKIQAKQPKRDRILTWHRKFDENILIDTIPFNFDQQESEGTKKLIYLLGPWYDTLKNNRILVVDELDSRLHTYQINHLVQYFNHVNNTNAQLIFVTHNTNTLSKDFFRRDQIWFIEKNQFGASDLYSLADFKSEKVRNKSAFDKNYIEGKYGAIPYFENKQKLIDLLYGE